MPICRRHVSHTCRANLKHCAGKTPEILRFARKNHKLKDTFKLNVRVIARSVVTIPTCVGCIVLQTYRLGIIPTINFQFTIVLCRNSSFQFTNASHCRNSSYQFTNTLCRNSSYYFTNTLCRNSSYQFTDILCRNSSFQFTITIALCRNSSFQFTVQEQFLLVH